MSFFFTVTGAELAKPLFKKEEQGPIAVSLQQESPHASREATMHVACTEQDRGSMGLEGEYGAPIEDVGFGFRAAETLKPRPLNPINQTLSYMRSLRVEGMMILL